VLSVRAGLRSKEIASPHPELTGALARLYGTGKPGRSAG